MRLRTLLVAIMAGLLVPVAALASSHSEAPGTNKDRLGDDTDLYAWVAKDAPDAVTIVGNWVPLIEPNSGPNFASFDDEARYYINVDNAGDALKHVRYRFSFQTTRQNPNTFLYNTGPVTSLDDPDLNVRQTYSITRVDNGVETVLASGLPVAPYFVGPSSMPDYASLASSAIQNLSDGTKVFVGPRDDPFFVDLAAVFDLLQIRKLPGDKGKGVDGVGGYNVMSIVIQIPKSRLTKDGQAPTAPSNNDIIGIWDTVERRQIRTLNGDGTVGLSGPWVQVSRLGNPLVNEVVIPLGQKDQFNASEPVNDVANFGAAVVDPEPARLLNLLFGISVPPAPRADIVAVFATGVAGLNQPAGVAPGEMLRLNLSIAPALIENRFGVIAGDLAGFPNGRRLADDVTDIALRVVAGVLVDGFNVAPNNQLGDGIDANDRPFLPYFPYVALPVNPLDHSHHEEEHGNSRSSIRGAAFGFGGDAESGGELEPKTSGSQPAKAGLSFAGPNPGSETALQFDIPNRARVSLRVFDLQGRLVRTLIDQDAAPGTFRASWNGADDSGRSAGKGVFFARLATDGQVVESRKIVLQ